MLYLFDIIAGSKRIRDFEGCEFLDLQAARDEALRCAGDQAAEELRSGRRFPSDWLVEILDGVGNKLATLPFASLVPNRQASALPAPNLAELGQPFLRSKAAFEETRRIAAAVSASFEEIRKTLDLLGTKQRLPAAD